MTLGRHTCLALLAGHSVRCEVARPFALSFQLCLLIPSCSWATTCVAISWGKCFIYSVAGRASLPLPTRARTHTHTHTHTCLIVKVTRYFIQPFSVLHNLGTFVLATLTTHHPGGMACWPAAGMRSKRNTELYTPSYTHTRMRSFGSQIIAHLLAKYATTSRRWTDRRGIWGFWSERSIRRGNDSTLYRKQHNALGRTM
ncbi:hypothetical protein F5Y17DRAFT_46796 [Xylariaceae sp. FL0594]|nr:hypothetical protein F5Y17DRAFT_46796 [Xylariaceae sp. FL0594]